MKTFLTLGRLCCIPAQLAMCLMLTSGVCLASNHARVDVLQRACKEEPRGAVAAADTAPSPRLQIDTKVTQIIVRSLASSRATQPPPSGSSASSSMTSLVPRSAPAPRRGLPALSGADLLPCITPAHRLSHHVPAYRAQPPRRGLPALPEAEQIWASVGEDRGCGLWLRGDQDCEAVAGWLLSPKSRDSYCMLIFLSFPLLARLARFACTMAEFSSASLNR